MDNGKTWDVIVVGGGPAGMMAAGAAAESGARVLLLEKNGTLGKKLLITGGGRCNVTNAELDTRALLSRFKDGGKFLFSAFAQWDVKKTLDFFHENGMATKIENELRVFPVSDSAGSVWNVLVERLKKFGVATRSNTAAIGIARKNGSLTGIQLQDGETIRGRSLIIATGGTSRPDTGSTGDGYAWLKDIGHTITLPTPSLVPIATKDTWVKRLVGTSIAGVKIVVFQNDKRQRVAKGKILFTHVGISGPTVLNMSKDIGELLNYGDVVLSLDLFPAEDHGALDIRLQKLLKTNHKKKLQNALSDFIQKALAPVLIELSGINGETMCNAITKEERSKLVHGMKDVRLHVKKLLGVEKAIVTSGGVALNEIDFKTMRSRLFPNLYLVGDLLDIDRPSGGYSLQLCWTTGFVAGRSAAESLRR